MYFCKYFYNPSQGDTPVMDKHGKKRPLVTSHVVPDDVG